MTVAEATPDLEVEPHDRSFLGHPTGLGYLSFVEGCERFSYYSMQTLLTLYMVKYLLLPGHIEGVVGLDWLRSWHYPGLDGQPLASAIFGDYAGLVYLAPILGGFIADRYSGRRAALLAGGLIMSLGHFLMAFEGAFLLALLSLVIGVGLFKGNIASQVGSLYKDNDLRRAMAFQIFYIAINVSVIAAPLVSGTLGEKVGWHYGFGTAGIVMVIGVLLFLKGKPYLPADEGGRDMTANNTVKATMLGVATTVAVIALVFLAGIWIALAALIPLYFYLASLVEKDERGRVLSLLLIVPALAIALLTNQEIFNAYLIWADEHFQLTFFGQTVPTSWMITIDAAVSFSMLVVVAAFWKWRSKVTGTEPDEFGKIIIGSFFTIAGGLCLYMAALTQGSGKIGLAWPLMFHLLNSIGFAHILPISLALVTKLAPRAINATAIGLYYLAFFGANKVVGYVGGLYSSLPTTTFWLLHVGSAIVGLVAFIILRATIGRHVVALTPAAG